MRAEIIIVLREGMKNNYPTIHLWVDERVFNGFNELGVVLDRNLKEIHWAGPHTFVGGNETGSENGWKRKENKGARQEEKMKLVLSQLKGKLNHLGNLFKQWWSVISLSVQKKK